MPHFSIQSIRKLNFNRPELWFLALATVFGVLFALITPIFRVPDEYSHLMRAYHVGSFKVHPIHIPGGIKGEPAVGGYIPTSLVELSINENGKAITPLQYLKQHRNQKLEPATPAAVAFGNTSQTTPLVYAPQAIGIDLGRLFNANPEIVALLGRLANLAVWVGVIYLAIKIAPIGKWVFAAFALTPISLQQAGSLSPDALTNSACFLFIALILRTITTKQLPTRHQWWQLYGVGVAVALCKLPFVMFSFLLFAIPSLSNKDRRQYLKLSAGLIMLMFVVTTAWVAYTQPYLITSNPVQQSSLPDQLRFIIHHPTWYAGTVIHTYASEWGDIYIPGAIGNLGLLELPLRMYDIVIGYIVLFWALVTSGLGSKVSFSLRQRLAGFGLYGTMALAITTLLYLSWTKVGDWRVAGIQSRYFLPLTPLLMFLFANREISLRHGQRWVGGAVVVGLLIVLSTTVVRMTHYYY